MVLSSSCSLFYNLLLLSRCCCFKWCSLDFFWCTASVKSVWFGWKFVLNETMSSCQTTKYCINCSMAICSINDYLFQKTMSTYVQGGKLVTKCALTRLSYVINLMTVRIMRMSMAICASIFMVSMTLLGAILKKKIKTVLWLLHLKLEDLIPLLFSAQENCKLQWMTFKWLGLWRISQVVHTYLKRG